MLKLDLLSAYVAMRKLQLQDKDFDKIIAGYKEVIEKNESNIPAHMQLSMLCQIKKDYKQAIEHYEKIIKIDPKFAPAANNLAYLYAGDSEVI